MKSKQQLIAGAATAVAATTAIYALASKAAGKRGDKKYDEVTVLIFVDGGEKCSQTNGLSPNAVTIHVGLRDATLRCIQKSIAKSLEVEFSQLQNIRLFVQATKEEITDKSNLEAVLTSKHGLTAVTLICTKDGADLSKEAAAGVPLEHFAKPSTVTDLSVLGMGHNLAFALGPHELKAFNGFENLFRGQDYKTCTIFSPPYSASTYSKDYPDLTYHPRRDCGDIATVDPDMITEMLARQPDFPKMWNTPIEKKIQEYTGFGLFSNSTTELSWETGHGVLPKFFNVIRIKNYFPIILEKTQSFVRQWTQLGNGHVIEDVQDWLTCMTADAVCKASMDMDMRNVERKGAREELHPFIKSFRYCVSAVKQQKKVEGEYKKQMQIGREIVEDIVERTRKGEIGGPLSFITGMLENKASTNGEFVHFETFYGHCINLMIAGHETTAGTLAFCMAELSRHPECLAKAVKEIEDVMGKRSSPTYEDIAKLEYVEACFREALRLYAPVQSTTRDSKYDTIVMGNKLLRRGQKIDVLFCGLHRDVDQWDQGVFGDVDSFNPDRHLPSAPPRHANSHCYFGFGVRSCIGMQFALLEAKVFLCMMLNFFNLETEPGYKVKPHVGSAFTAAPDELKLKLTYRENGPLSRVNLFDTRRSSVGKPIPLEVVKGVEPSTEDKQNSNGGSVLILYGSNTGTCEEFANLLAEKATEFGFKPEIMTLDQSISKLPVTDCPVLIVTSTYNGTPPDNANKFNEWMYALKEDSLTGMKFSVFGCGNSNWEATYQKFPGDVNSQFLACGGTQIKEVAKADVSTANFAEEFDDWAESVMGVVGLDNGATATAAKKTAAKRMKYVVNGNAETPNKVPVKDEIQLLEKLDECLDPHVPLDREYKAGFDFYPCEVTKSVELQSEYSDRSTCHVEFKLGSSEQKYTAGDHLAVISCNGNHMVNNTLEALGLKGDEIVECNPGYVVFSNKFPKDLPGIPLTTRLAIEWLPDLFAAPSKKVLNHLAELCPCPPEAAGIKALADDKNYKEKVLDTNMTLTEVLLKYRSIDIDIEEFCASLPRLKPRYYSISSSPLVDPSRVSVTVGLVEYDTKLGRHHKGVASGMINTLNPGTKVICAIQQLNSKFRLPADLDKPILMVGPGTGVAPFMGFLEERDALVKQGKKLGPAHLFFGCRSSKTDFIYKDTLQGYVENGVLASDGLHVAFSREEGQSKVYVQDLIEESSEKLWDLIEKGATVYICGDAKRMSPGVKSAFINVASKHMTQTEAERWMGSMLSNGRYLEDVYA